MIKADVLRREYRTAQHQLKLCVGGFGASPHSRGSAVFCQDLCSGQTSRFERRDILGTVKPEMLPAWAKQKLDEMQTSRSKPGREQER